MVDCCIVEFVLLDFSTLCWLQRGNNSLSKERRVCERERRGEGERERHLIRHSMLSLFIKCVNRMEFSSDHIKK